MWSKEIDQHGSEDLIKLLVGNKSDMEIKKVVDYTRAKVRLVAFFITPESLLLFYGGAASWTANQRVGSSGILLSCVDTSLRTDRLKMFSRGACVKEGTVLC